MKRTETTRRSALRSGCSAAGAAARTTGAPAAAKAYPQVAQNFASDRFGAPQLGHGDSSGVPQLSQNRLPARFSVPHAVQRIAAERRAEQDRIDAAKRADEERQAAIEAERRRVSEEKAKAEAEDAARAANRRHRERINREARDALVALSLTTEHAALILNAIAAGKVPHVKITY